MSDVQVWVVRAGVNNEIAREVEKSSVIAIGWTEMGDPTQLSGRDEFKARYKSTYAEDSNAKIAIGAGQVYRFVREIQKGDLVLTPIAVSREILVGKVVGDHIFDPSTISKFYPNVRKVKWLKKVSRDDVSAPFRNALGGIMTVFTVNAYLQEVKTILGEQPAVELPEVEQPPFYEDTREKADEMISDLLDKIGAYDFQDLVAGLLQAMGFRTRVSPPGPDGGVDIKAFPDAFGFESPRIRVQVKHRKGQATQQQVQQFAGAIGSSGESYNGLFVSTGGFTPHASREAEKHPNITLIDRQAFVDLLLEHYEKLEPQFKALVPLRKIYIPVPPI